MVEWHFTVGGGFLFASTLKRVATQTVYISACSYFTNRGSTKRRLVVKVLAKHVFANCIKFVIHYFKCHRTNYLHFVCRPLRLLVRIVYLRILFSYLRKL